MKKLYEGDVDVCAVPQLLGVPPKLEHNEQTLCYWTLGSCLISRIITTLTQR